MSLRKWQRPLCVFAVCALTAGVAWALGFKLGESKEQLGLDYEVLVTDHGTGRITVNLTISDQGRLTPLRSVYFVIPGEGDSGPVDLSLELGTTETDGILGTRVHLKKELVDRAEFQLRTAHLDGKQEALTWYYHAIPISEYLEDESTGKK